MIELQVMEKKGANLKNYPDWISPMIEMQVMEKKGAYWIKVRIAPLSP